MAQNRGQEGFTLLELVVALGIVSIAIAGLLSVFGSTLSTTAVDLHRVDAAALATAEMSLLHGAPYGATSPTSHSVTREGQTYTIADQTGWATSSGGQSQAYQSLVVIVSWVDRGGSHGLRQDGARYERDPAPSPPPAGCAVPAGAVAAVAATPVAPADAIDVGWTEPNGATPATAWQLEVSPDGVAWTSQLRAEPAMAAGTAHAVELGGLAPGASYQVRITATAPCGEGPAAVVGAAASGRSNGSCSLGALTLDHPVAARGSGGSTPGALSADVAVSVTSTGPCPGGLWVGAAPTAGTTTTAALTSSTPGVYGTILPATGQAWDLGRHLVEVFSGSPVAGPLPPTRLGSVVLCVETAGSGTC
jgi:prepilin-type N-terminal cleavage/methylation domain-containing protein